MLRNGGSGFCSEHKGQVLANYDRVHIRDKAMEHKIPCHPCLKKKVFINLVF